MNKKDFKPDRRIRTGIAVLFIAALCIAAGIVGKISLAGGVHAGEEKAEKQSQKVSKEEAVTVEELSAMDIMCEPCGIASMEDGTLLVTDTYGKTVWHVKDGKSTVYTGGETVEDPYGEPLGGYNDADLKKSYFKEPWAIAPFLDGYAVSDSENNVVRLFRRNQVETVNGSTEEQLTVTELGVAFDHPTGLAADKQGNLYIADTGLDAVRMITPEGDVTTVAENLSGPMGMCWKDGALYVAETGANRILKIQDKEVSLAAGNGEDDRIDGKAEAAAFSMPKGVAAGDDGAVYVADTGNSAVRRIYEGEVTTVFARDIDDLSSFTPVSPIGMLIADGRLYVCDNFSRKIFVIKLEDIEG